MRTAVTHILAALLIAVFAIGAPQSVRVDCPACQECSVSTPAEGHAPCSQDALTCQIAQNCANQLQKMSAQSTILIAQILAGLTFGEVAAAAIKSAYILPETTPPRL